jgi:hypothetical protein
MPRACKSFARDAAIIPFPNEEVTPPVTKIYLAIIFKLRQLKKLSKWIWYDLLNYRCKTVTRRSCKPTANFLILRNGERRLWITGVLRGLGPAI